MMAPFSIRPAIFPARPGSASTSATSCSSTARSGRTSTSSPGLYRLRLLNGCNARILHASPRPAPRCGSSARRVGMPGIAPVPVSHSWCSHPQRGPTCWSTSPRWRATAPFGSPTISPRPTCPPLRPRRFTERSCSFASAARGGLRSAEAPPHHLFGGRAARLPTPPPPHRRRFITLNEVRRRHGRAGNSPSTALASTTPPPTETPRVGSVEDWYFINLTGDTHPMHVHLFMFQIVRTRPLRRRLAYIARRRPTRRRRPRRHQPLAIRHRPHDPRRPHRTRLQRHRQSQPRHLHHHPRPL